MKKLLLLFGAFVIFLGCKNTAEEISTDPQQIIDKVIEAAGGEGYENFELDFDFRDKKYRSFRKDGVFVYSRQTTSADTTTVESYGNQDAFKRLVNGIEEIIPDSLSAKIQNSINSVNYFVLLPYGLNDPAVNKSYLGKSVIKGEEYHKIKVTFNEEGGGKDFHDIFVYWIHISDYTIDYLAYKYFIDGGGMRFREAFNPRVINGLRFVDYRNYKPHDKSIDLEDLDAAFEEGNLKLLSTIENKNIKVNR